MQNVIVVLDRNQTCKRRDWGTRAHPSASGFSCFQARSKWFVFFFLKSPIKLLRHKLSLLQNSISCRVIFRCCTVLSDYNYHNTAWLPKQRPRVERRPSSPHLTTSPPKTRETLMQPVFEQSGTRQSRGLPLGMLWSSEGWEEKRRWCIVASAVSEGSWWPSPLRSIFFFSNLLPISSVNI